MQFVSRVLLACTLLATAAFSEAQIKAALYENGKPSGSATLNLVVKPSRNVVVSMDLISAKGHLRISESYNPSGMPIEEDLTGLQGSQMVKMRVVFGAKAAKVTASLGGKTHSRQFPYPKGANLKEISSLWFATVRPKVGEVNAYSEFDIAASGWKAMTAKYVGDQKIKYHGKVVVAHKIVGTDATSWVDDKGLPYRIQNQKSDDLVVRL